MANDLFDAVILDEGELERPAFRQAPAGDYRVMVRSAKRVKARTGTEGIELDLTLVEPLNGDADMEGVDLSRCRLRNTIWVTANNVEISRSILRRIMPELVGKEWSFATVIDDLPGAEVVVQLSHTTEDRDGNPLRTPRLEVDKYFSMDWYNKNSRSRAA
jgi:hypothetical protein